MMQWGAKGLSLGYVQHRGPGSKYSVCLRGPPLCYTGLVAEAEKVDGSGNRPAHTSSWHSSSLVAFQLPNDFGWLFSIAASFEHLRSQKSSRARFSWPLLRPTSQCHAWILAEVPRCFEAFRFWLSNRAFAAASMLLILTVPSGESRKDHRLTDGPGLLRQGRKSSA